MYPAAKCTDIDRTAKFSTLQTHSMKSPVYPVQQSLVTKHIFDRNKFLLLIERAIRR